MQRAGSGAPGASLQSGTDCSIVVARWPDHSAVARELLAEYAGWLGRAACMDPELVQPDLPDELANLERWYTAPEGRMLLAEVDGQVVGLAGVHALRPGTAELKRVYLQPGARGRHLGRRLVEAAIVEARLLGFDCVILETSPKVMPVAYRLYLDVGFRPAARYSRLDLPGVVAMESSCQPDRAPFHRRR
jgi:GNAT superfamily N-acetyltransferase